MIIKIISGVFGYNDGKHITPITPQDGPIDVDAKVAKRLVEQGSAEYVKAEAKKEPENTPDDDKPVNLNSLNKAKLLELCEEAGIEADESMTKAKLIQLIEAEPENPKADDDSDSDADADADDDAEGGPDLGDDGVA